MYSNTKYHENICNCLRVIQDINRKLKSANCWQQTSLNQEQNGTKAYEETSIDEKSVVDSHLIELPLKCSVGVKERLPKLHKTV